MVPLKAIAGPLSTRHERDQLLLYLRCETGAGAGISNLARLTWMLSGKARCFLEFDQNQTLAR